MNVTLKCENCGNNFVTEYKHRDKKYCGRECFFKHKKVGRLKDDKNYEDRECLVCKKVFNIRKKYKKTMCSKECRDIMAKKTKDERIDKSKQVLIEKYGVESFFKLKTTREKLKSVFTNKYGVDNPMKLDEIKHKIKEKIREKTREKLIEKLKNENLELLDEYNSNKNNNGLPYYNFKCLVCNSKFNSTLLGCGRMPICRKCNPISKNSSLEMKIKEFLDQKNINYLIGNRKILNGLEIDIFLPEYNLGIEINGNHFHSSKFKNIDYHLNKTKIANEKGIKLIHIMEDEIVRKFDIVKSRILTQIGKSEKIFARKCRIDSISSSDAKAFIEKNHIQGYTVDSIRYGLFYKDELVSVMTFSRPRRPLGSKKLKNNEFELVRFSNKLNTSVIGGFSKLLNHFMKKYSNANLFSYADIRWSGIDFKNTVYCKNGFEFVGQSKPNYWYVHKNDLSNRYHRYNFRKDKLIKDGFDPNKTEKEIMIDRGFIMVYDCGNLKFVYSNK